MVEISHIPKANPEPTLKSNCNLKPEVHGKLGIISLMPYQVIKLIIMHRTGPSAIFFVSDTTREAGCANKAQDLNLTENQLGTEI